jgi:hypothetical protein
LAIGLPFLNVLFIPIFITLSNSDPTDNTLANAFQAENNDIKPIPNEGNLTREVINSSSERLLNSIRSADMPVGVWGPFLIVVILSKN